MSCHISICMRLKKSRKRDRNLFPSKKDKDEIGILSKNFKIFRQIIMTHHDPYLGAIIFPTSKLDVMPVLFLESQANHEEKCEHITGHRGIYGILNALKGRHKWKTIPYKLSRREKFASPTIEIELILNYQIRKFWSKMISSF